MALSPCESWIQTALCRTPTEVISERPSGATAKPSSSAGPNVSCSGLPSGNACRQRWLAPLTSAPKYIQFPSGDQPAEVQSPVGPTCLPGEPPPRGTIRQGNQPGSISTTRAHFRSGEG